MKEAAGVVVCAGGINYLSSFCITFFHLAKPELEIWTGLLLLSME